MIADLECSLSKYAIEHAFVLQAELFWTRVKLSDFVTRGIDRHSNVRLGHLFDHKTLRLYI